MFSSCEKPEIDRARGRNATGLEGESSTPVLLYVVPGLAQIAKGEKRKGLILLSVGGATLATTVALLNAKATANLLAAGISGAGGQPNMDMLRTFANFGPINALPAAIAFSAVVFHSILDAQRTTQDMPSYGNAVGFSEWIARSYAGHLAGLLLLCGVLVFSQTGTTQKPLAACEFVLQNTNEKNPAASQRIAEHSAKDHGMKDPKRRENTTQHPSPHAATKPEPSVPAHKARPHHQQQQPPRQEQQQQQPQSRQQQQQKRPQQHRKSEKTGSKQALSLASQHPPGDSKTSNNSRAKKQPQTNRTHQNQQVPRRQQTQRHQQRAQRYERPQHVRQYEAAQPFSPADRMAPSSLNTEHDTDRQSASYAARESADFGPYMNYLHRRLAKHWDPPPGYSGRAVTVSFKVTRNGDLFGLRVSRSCGNRAFDSAALNAVRAAAPFRALPAGSDPAVNIEFTFDYHISAH